MSSLSVEDLDLIETDLDFDQKVSLLFLLYGHRNPKYLLQSLAVATRAPDAKTQFLLEWKNLVATNEEFRWHMELLEALAIVQANVCLLRCGFDDEELRGQFLPHIPELASYVHPILKGLWLLCEKIDNGAGQKLIEYINQNHDLKLPQSIFLEVALLELIDVRIIRLGSKEGNIPCDLGNLIAAFKGLEMMNHQDFCKNIEKDFNRSLRLEKNQSDDSVSNLISEVGTTSVDKVTLVESYIITKKNAGVILIVNQFKFYRETNPDLIELLPSEPLKNRRGTEIDKLAIMNLFIGLGYESIVVENITHLEILNHVEKAVNQVKQNHCSLIVCLLSHGQEGKIYGSNSIPVNVRNIERIMASEKLTGKPKLLFVQACQGSGLQTAVNVVSRLEHDGPSTEMTASVFVDFLVAWSTVPGFASIRHIEKGSWFIQELCQKIKQLRGKHHLMDILTAVINDVSAKRGYENECMVPIIYSTLRKKLYFESPRN